MTDAAYSRYLADPTFAAAVRERYRGRHDPADALWWLLHPDQPGPSGARPPSEQRDALARRAYSREGAADPGLASALASLDAAIAADRAAIADALVVPDSPLERPALPVTPTPVVATEGTTPRRRSKRAPVWAVMVGALVIGALGGAVITRALTPVDTTWSGQFDVQDEDAENPFATIFDTPPVATDLPDIAMSSRFEPDTFHRLTRTEGGDGEPVAYAVRDTSNRFCVVLVIEETSAANCVGDKFFPASGLIVELSDATNSYTVKLDADGSMSRSAAPLNPREPAQQDD